MLPTEKASNIFEYKNNLQFIKTQQVNTFKGGSNQHLYLTSNEEIKERDWCINKNQDTLYQITNKDGEYPNRTDIRNHWNKIIATTNKSISRSSNIKMSVKDALNTLPLIPESFIKAYVEAQGNIKEVLVEYVDKGREEWVGDDYNGEPQWFEDIQLKLRNDNTVIIHQAKTYTREEIIEFGSWYSGMSKDKVEKQFNKWIKENL